MSEEKKCDALKAGAVGLFLGLPTAAVLSKVLDEESALSRLYNYLKTRVVEPKVNAEATKLEEERLIGRPHFL